MTFDTIVPLIGSLGFPIVMCLLLFYYMNKTLKEMQTSINNNTIAITNLIDELKSKKGNNND